MVIVRCGLPSDLALSRDLFPIAQNASRKPGQAAASPTPLRTEPDPQPRLIVAALSPRLNDTTKRRPGVNHRGDHRFEKLRTPILSDSATQIIIDYLKGHTVA